MNTNIFRFLAIFIFILGAGISIYFRRKADRNDEERISLREEGLLIMISLRVLDEYRIYMKNTGRFLPKLG